MVVESIIIGKIVIGKIVAHPAVVAAHQSLAQTVAEWATPVAPVAFGAGKEWLSKSHFDSRKKEALATALDGAHTAVSDWLKGHTPALEAGPGTA